jgi:hypothetical protein
LINCIAIIYELCFIVGVDESFQQNNDSVITDLMKLTSPQKECYNTVMKNTDVPYSTKLKIFSFHLVHKKMVILIKPIFYILDFDSGSDSL